MLARPFSSSRSEPAERQPLLPPPRELVWNYVEGGAPRDVLVAAPRELVRAAVAPVRRVPLDVDEADAIVPPRLLSTIHHSNILLLGYIAY